MVKRKTRKLSPRRQDGEELKKAASNVISLWMEFRKYFSLAFSQTKTIQPGDEQKFLEIKSNMARLQRFLAQRLPHGFHYGSAAITEVMGQSISIEALRDLPKTDKKTLYERWHSSYIRQQNLLGILDVMGEGHPVTFEDAKPAKTGNIKESMGLTGKKSNTGKVKQIVVTIIVAAAVAAFYFYRTQ